MTDKGSETLETRARKLSAAWMQFLVEHPTRGGLAERLLFESGWRAHEEQIVNDGSGVAREMIAELRKAEEEWRSAAFKEIGILRAELKGKADSLKVMAKKFESSPRYGVREKSTGDIPHGK